MKLLKFMLLMSGVVLGLVLCGTAFALPATMIIVALEY